MKDPPEASFTIAFSYATICLFPEEGSWAGLQCHFSAVTVTCLDLKTHSVKGALGDVVTTPSMQFITSREECFNDVVMIYWPCKGLLKSRLC